METIGKLADNYFYLAAVILFVIGAHTMLTHSNMIKKVIAMNIMDSSVFLLFVAIGYVKGGQAPIIRETAEMVYVNPLPGALIVTGIVVAVSVTAYALSIIVRIQKSFGTVDCDELCDMRSED